MRRQQFAPIDARLNGAQATQYSHLLNIANNRYYIEPLELRVDRMEAAD